MTGRWWCRCAGCGIPRPAGPGVWVGIDAVLQRLGDGAVVGAGDDEVQHSEPPGNGARSVGLGSATTVLGPSRLSIAQVISRTHRGRDRFDTAVAQTVLPASTNSTAPTATSAPSSSATIWI